MRVELSMAPMVLPREPDTVKPRFRGRLRRYEIGLLAVFAAMSMWVVAIDLWQVIAHGWVWTGTDGFYIVDQMQYLAWIQSASHHVFSANLFVLRGTPADYFQPAVAISGAITALGVAPWLALLLWKPVAVVAIFFGIRAYIARAVPSGPGRAVALTLGLFFASVSLVYGKLSIVGDLVPGFLSWGYPFGLMATAGLLFALLSYDRARTDRRVAWTPGLLGMLAAGLHPWQGEMLILIVLGAELMRRREPAGRARLGLALVTVSLTATPLVYYLLLGHLDISWALAREASQHGFPLVSILLAIAPLALVAVLGYRGRSQDFLELVTRLWPAAALVIYLLSATGLSGAPLHAFVGITIPLAVLAVNGARRAGWARVPRHRLITGLAIAAATIPANIYALGEARSQIKPGPGNANFITHDERAALDYLRDDPDPGGVLTQFYLGEAVPGRTGRRTLVGDCVWSEPNCFPRSLAADALFQGALSRRAARRFVLDSGARFVLADCAGPHQNLARKLVSVVISVRRFGCATVYELDSPGEARGPLAELPSHASVRAPRRY
ncbi:MAG TPA: hypothetical protein VIL82_05470 [Solirubrobacteraceae bacterium]